MGCFCHTELLEDGGERVQQHRHDSSEEDQEWVAKGPLRQVDLDFGSDGR